MKTINDFLTPEDLEMASPSATNSVSRINSTTSRSAVKEALRKELEATRLMATNSVSRLNSSNRRLESVRAKHKPKPQTKSRATTSKGRAPITDVWPEITLKEQPKIPDGVLAPRQKRGLL